MKTLKLLLVLATLLTTSSIIAQDQYLKKKDTPKQIITYVKKHFPSNRILDVKKEVEKTTCEYEVKLDNEVEITFNDNLSVKSIEANSTSLPHSVIPSDILKYVIANYSANQIISWEQTKKGQKIGLDNDLDLYFDNNGKFLKKKR